MVGSRTEEPSAPHRGMQRVTGWRESVRRRPGGWIAWRIAVTVVGVAVIAGGIVLLPLPGPGWLIIFAGLGVLGTEYDWAKRLLRWLRGIVQQWSRWVLRRPRWLQALIGLAGIAFLAAIAYAAWTLYR